MEYQRYTFRQFVAAALVLTSTTGICLDNPVAPPYPDIHASKDPTTIERGRYIVHHLAVCGHCHASDVNGPGHGSDVPLSGNLQKNNPMVAPSANLTPDAETGIGNWTDPAIARALRYSFGHDDHVMQPWMEFNFSDDDLVAIVSYLRTQQPVKNDALEEARKTFAQRPARAIAMPTAERPTASALKVSPRGASLANGRYLLESATDCKSCHTSRTSKGAQYFGGGSYPDFNDRRVTWYPPNLTRAGRTGMFTEEEFIQRFRTGRVLDNSPMPWEGYQTMNESDLRAIYRFLKSLAPVQSLARPPFEIRQTPNERISPN